MHNRIRELRFDMDMSQETLARQANLSVQVIRNLENGRGYGSYRSRLKIAKALGKEITEVFPDGEGVTKNAQ